MHYNRNTCDITIGYRSNICSEEKKKKKDQKWERPFVQLSLQIDSTCNLSCLFTD